MRCMLRPAQTGLWYGKGYLLKAKKRRLPLRLRTHNNSIFDLVGGNLHLTSKKGEMQGCISLQKTLSFAEALSFSRGID